MSLPALDIFLALPAFALVLFRVSGMVITAPIFGSTVIPMKIRVAITISLTFTTFPLLSAKLPTVPTLGMVAAGAAGELMVGAAIGLALSIILLAGEVVGTLVGQQAGLSLGEVSNPLQDAQVSVLGQIYTTVLMLVFLLAGGHRAIISAVLDSYTAVPLFAVPDSQPIVLLLAETLAAAFVIGIRIAGPAMIALFLAALTLAVLSRAMPQLNILSVGFTMKVLLALGVAWLTLGLAEDQMIEAVVDGLDTVRAALHIPPARMGTSF